MYEEVRSAVSRTSTGRSLSLVLVINDNKLLMSLYLGDLN